MTQCDKSPAGLPEVVCCQPPAYRGMTHTQLRARLMEEVACLDPAEAVLLADWMERHLTERRSFDSVLRPAIPNR